MRLEKLEDPKDKKEKTEFDPDYPPSNPQNKEAARDHGLKYDSKAEVYRDEDGCLIRDKFGQEF